MKVSGHSFAVEQLRAALQTTQRVIVIHPNFIQRHVLLTSLLHNIVYVRLTGRHLTVDVVREQVDIALKQQETSLASLSVAQALILDESDRIQPEALHQVLQDIIAHFAAKVIVFSRALPHRLFQDADMRAHVALVPTGDSQMLWDYARRSASGGALLEVRALGEGRVHLNGVDIDEWDGQLPRALFYFLVDRGMVTRSEIFDTFWPTLQPREATNVFHVTKRKISEVLGVDLTVYWSGFYHISPRIQLSYDAALFTQMIQDSAVMGFEQSIQLSEDAIELYRGDFLSSLDMAWAIRRRHDLRQTLGEALIALAKTNERIGNHQLSLGLYLRAAATNRQREDVVASIMRLYRMLAMPHDALHVYHRLEHELATALNVTPTPALRELAAQIEREIH
jgi:DNA-binding SARP family transcriptional activator